MSTRICSTRKKPDPMRATHAYPPVSSTPEGMKKHATMLPRMSTPLNAQYPRCAPSLTADSTAISEKKSVSTNEMRNTASSPLQYTKVPVDSPYTCTVTLPLEHADV